MERCVYAAGPRFGMWLPRKRDAPGQCADAPKRISGRSTGPRLALAVRNSYGDSGVHRAAGQVDGLDGDGVNAAGPGGQALGPEVQCQVAGQDNIRWTDRLVRANSNDLAGSRLSLSIGGNDSDSHR